MIISSAHLFGKTLKAGEPPIADNVYFEDGVFNTTLAYPNTSLSDKKTLTGAFTFFNNGGGSYLYDLIKDDIGSGQIIQCLGSNAGQYVLNNNKIVCDIASPQANFDKDFGLLLLPVRIPPNRYTSMSGTFLMSNKIYGVDMYNLHFYQSYVSGSAPWQSMAAGAYTYAPDRFDVTFDLTTIDTWYDDMVYIGISTGGYRHTEIHKLWFNT